jgi:biopolymer transport protein ExbD
VKFGTSRNLDRGRPLINVVSMIDVTFLLLSFFLVTSGGKGLEGRLVGALGTATGAKGDLQAVVVEVMGTPGAAWCRVAGRRIDGVEALKATLQPLPKEPGVAIRVHDGPSVGDAAAVLQAARDAGFQRVSYAPAS